jgi:hypothetical protein
MAAHRPSRLVPDARETGLALTGGWDPFPRKVRRGDKKRFLPVVASLLKAAADPPKGKPAIAKVSQVDLDGDGADDFVVAAKGKDFWLAAVVWSKPSGEQVELVSLLVNDVSVGGEVEVLDANGDGRLELLLQSYVEGDDYTELHELDTDGKHHEVLRTYHGC